MAFRLAEKGNDVIITYVYGTDGKKGRGIKI
jgi:hypothetical protein